MTAVLDVITPTTSAPATIAPLAYPAGLQPWREASLFRERTTAPSIDDTRAVLAAVREGSELGELSETLDLSCDRILDVVVGVGSRISQANKRGPKVDSCVSATAGSALGMGPGAHIDGSGKLIVVLARGWDRAAAHGRDVSRAYGAIAASDSVGDDRPIERWLATLACEQPLTYGHFAHLYSVATGKMRTLAGVTDDPDVQEAYLRAFDIVSSAVVRASAGVGTLCRPSVTLDEIGAALQESFWMLGDIARRIHTLARAVHQGDERAEAALHAALRQLRASVARTPARYFPRSLSDLNVAQFRAICARAGFRVQDFQDAAREETDLSDLTSALLAVRSRMDSGMDLDSAADEVSRLSALWRGEQS